MANDQQLRDLTFWSMGSLAGATWTKIAAASPIILLSFTALPFMARGLNAITLGEAAAFHMGVPVQRLKNVAIVGVAAATGASVAVSGGIGFVGIVVPHILRMAIGPDHRFLLLSRSSARRLSADLRGCPGAHPGRPGRAADRHHHRGGRRPILPVDPAEAAFAPCSVSAPGE